MFDFAGFPHIDDRIIDLADADCLYALRLTTTSFRRYVDKRLQSHVIIKHDFRGGWKLSSRILPLWSKDWNNSWERLARHIDLVEELGTVGGVWSAKASLDHQLAIANTRVIRTRRPLLARYPPAPVLWRRFLQIPTAIYPCLRSLPNGGRLRVCDPGVRGDNTVNSQRIILVVKAAPKDDIGIHYCLGWTGAVELCLLPPRSPSPPLGKAASLRSFALFCLLGNLLSVSYRPGTSWTFVGLEAWDYLVASGDEERAWPERLLNAYSCDHAVEQSEAFWRVGERVKCVTLAEWREGIGEEIWQLVDTAHDAF